MEIMIKIEHLTAHLTVYKGDVYGVYTDTGWCGQCELTLAGQEYKGHLQECGEYVVMELDSAAIEQLNRDEVPFIAL